MKVQSISASDSTALAPNIKLDPIANLSGQLDLPGSKSLANRILLLAALSEGKSIITNVPKADDVQLMIEALRYLGVNIEETSNKEVAVHGLSGRLPEGEYQLKVGNAGTIMRPLAAILCYGSGRYELQGTERMNNRPIGALMEGMRQLGALPEYSHQTGYPPVTVGQATSKWHRRAMGGGTVSISSSKSSQFLSSMLMAAPLGRELVKLMLVDEPISRPYIDMTINLMNSFGVEAKWTGNKCLEVAGGQHYQAIDQIRVEGDASSASYFLAGAAISGGEVTVTGCGLDSIQGDIRFAEILERMGASVSWGHDWVMVKGKPFYYWENAEKPLKGIDINMVDMPDVAMTLAVTAMFSEGPTKIRGIGSWQFKETDRIKAMSNELTKLGAKVTVENNELTIYPPKEMKKVGIIETYQDHRMAMSFSLIPCAGMDVVIQNPSCVSKTFPSFFKHLFKMATFAEVAA